MKATSVSALLLALFFPPMSVPGQSLEWSRQLGSKTADFGYGVSADGLGSVYISGFTRGNMDGANAGGRDAFLSKYDDSGNFQWTRQLGTDRADESIGVSADGLGSVYISGLTDGSLEGLNAGDRDAFLSKYDDSGTLQWTRQFGTDRDDLGFIVSADGLGSVYMTGYTEGSLGGPNAGDRDAFLTKHDDSGMHQWTRQIGTVSYDVGNGVSADGLGGVYITGSTAGGLEGATNTGDRDVFLSKYNDSGTLRWTRQFGTELADEGFGVSADGLGSIYITGWTEGDLGGPNAGDSDAFLSKYDDSGTLQWTRQIGTNSADQSFDVSVDGLGGVYIAGGTEGSLDGLNAGSRDVFISKYNDSGTLQWTRQIGTDQWDESIGASANGVDSVYITGSTEGSLGGPNVRFGWDVFVAKYSTNLSELGCDFDANVSCDIADVDMLVGEIIAGTNDSTFDLTGDETVDDGDLNQWLSDAATENGFTAPYLLGDANLDGTVNASDLNILGIRWHQEEALWSAGDFNADGTVNAGDLNKLGLSWQMSIPTAASSESVPEPAAITLLIGIIATPLLRHRICFSS